MLSQSAYYQSLGLHPDAVAVEDPAVFARHARLRQHLYQNLLHIPFGLLAGAEILDVGCGMGENALVLARQGARLTLVDQDPTIATRLHVLFRDFGVAGNLRELIIGDIQSLSFDRRFALATAEGFVATLPDRDAVIERICAVLVPGGIAVTSYPDRFGSFFEFVKKAVMWRAYQLAGITDLLDDRAEALAARQDHAGSLARSFAGVKRERSAMIDPAAMIAAIPSSADAPKVCPQSTWPQIAEAISRRYSNTAT